MPNFDLIRPQSIPPRQNFPAKPLKKRRRFWKWLLILLIIVGALGWGAHRLLSKTNQIFTNNGNLFTRISNLIISPDKPLEGEENGTINVLLMGVGGDGHEGAYLTDTMIVAEINVKTNEVTLVSIPRDFTFNIPKVGFNRINAAYAYAYRDNPNTAGDAAIGAAEDVTGLKIPYYAVIDFKGFVKAVDDVGGVDVVVEHTFTDATFPNDYPYDTKGYLSPVTFTKGPAHMNGRTALIFARSRHSPDNNEGSDFARSERQKKIITALKEKVFKLNLTGLSTINNLLSDFSENFRTNLEPYQIKRLVDLSSKINNNNIFSFSLEPQDNLICSELIDANTGKRIITPAPAPPAPPTPAPGAPTNNTTNPDTATKPAEPEVVRMYVIEPCAGKTLADIHQYVQEAPILAKLRKEGAVVEIQNSVGKTGLANQLFGKLTELGLTVRYSTFKGKVPYDQTILYDNTSGSKPYTLDYLKQNFDLMPSDVGYPSSPADFFIVIGKDQL